MGLVDSSEVKRLALELGFTTVGIAPIDVPSEALSAYHQWIEDGFHGEMGYMAENEPLKQDVRSLLPTAKSVIAVSLSYYQQPSASIKIARYALGRDYHKVLRGKLKRLADELGHIFPDSDWRACVDSAPVLERTFAHLAGLGWFGKNTMLIDSRRGSWFFIGLLLSSVEFQSDAPSIGGCGTCKKCIEACPTGAIVQVADRWQVDARSCISYQTIEKKGSLEVNTDGWVFGCDVCQEVCPFNEVRNSQPLRSATTTEPDFLRQRRFPTLFELANLGHADWDELTKGSAIRRTGLEGLTRNALAALRPSHGQHDE